MKEWTMVLTAILLALSFGCSSMNSRVEWEQGREVTIKGFGETEKIALANAKKTAEKSFPGYIVKGWPQCNLVDRGALESDRARHDNYWVCTLVIIKR